MSELVYIDDADGIQRVMNNKGLYQKLLKKFASGVYMANIAGAYKANDLEKAKVAVHTLKGVSANLSLKALNEFSIQVDLHVKAGQMDKADCSGLQVLYDDTVKAINAYCA
jgi:HPt (histidine-containing phosphotransfer) domain-containing protein